MNITAEDILDPNQLNEVEKQIYEAARQQLAERLVWEITTPLPEEPTDYAKALENRTVLLKAFREYSNLLTEKKPLEIQTWDEIKLVDRKWIIPSWLPENTTTLFTGQGGAGKSWFTLQLVCQLTGGFTEWSAINPDVSTDSNAAVPHNIVLATYEDEPAEIKRRIHTLTREMEWVEETLDTITKHLHIVDMRGAGSIWGPGMGNHIANIGDILPAGYQLQNICEEKNAKLLIIDPLSGAFGGNENDRTAVYDFISSFRKWGDTAKCAILFVGHLPKYAEGKSAGFSGSTAWEASVRSMWLLSIQKQNDDKDDNQYYALSHTKSNYARLQDEIPLVKSNNGWWKKAKDVEDAVEGYKKYHEKKEETNDENTNDILGR